MRLLLTVLLFFSLLHTASSQKPRKFYWQVSPDYTFLRVTKNTPEINTRILTVPFFGFGIGYLFIPGNKTVLDVSAGYHGVHTSIHTTQVTGRNFLFRPQLSATIMQTLNNRSSHRQIYANAGLSLSYDPGGEDMLTLSDTIHDMYVEKREVRKRSVLVYANVGIGVLFKRRKRNFLLNVQYGQGFQTVYTWNYTYRDKGQTFLSAVTGKDSYMVIQCKFFRKNRVKEGS